MSGENWLSVDGYNGMEAHPRVSGENRVETLARRVLRGSSPRERGKPCSAVWACKLTGLIPA